MSLTVWTNAKFSDAAMRRLEAGLGAHRLAVSAFRDAQILAPGKPDPALADADIAFGQPDVGDCLRYARLRWVHLTTAGFARYDTEEFRQNFRARPASLTKSSTVFAEPVAQHALAMMLALDRQLLGIYRDQLQDRSWRMDQHRAVSHLLRGSMVLLLGFGMIGQRIAELLQPWGCEVYAVRRQTRSERGVKIIAEAELSAVLGRADHVVNVLPASEATTNYVNARRLSCCKRGARFYNVGRGTTVDQKALLEALQSGALGSAYLDVTDPEPLPPEHPLWTAPNCYITPHTAGGRSDQQEALVDHFLGNLARWEKGQPLTDVVV